MSTAPAHSAANTQSTTTPPTNTNFQPPKNGVSIGTLREMTQYLQTSSECIFDAAPFVISYPPTTGRLWCDETDSWRHMPRKVARYRADHGVLRDMAAVVMKEHKELLDGDDEGRELLEVLRMVKMRSELVVERFAGPDDDSEHSGGPVMGFSSAIVWGVKWLWSLLMGRG